MPPSRMPHPSPPIHRKQGQSLPVLVWNPGLVIVIPRNSDGFFLYSRSHHPSSQPGLCGSPLRLTWFRVLWALTPQQVGVEAKRK